MTDSEIVENMGFEICEFPPDDDCCDCCKEPRNQLYFSEPTDAGRYLCLDCIKDEYFENIAELKRIEKLEADGHPPHCATRQVYGDGECECDMYARGYDPDAWKSGAKPVIASDRRERGNDG